MEQLIHVDLALADVVVDTCAAHCADDAKEDVTMDNAAMDNAANMVTALRAAHAAQVLPHHKDAVDAVVLPKETQYELLWLCRSYNKLKQQRAQAYKLPSISYDNTGAAKPKTGTHSDPTAQAGIAAAMISSKLDAIDDALAYAADDVMREYLRRSVCDGIKYEYLGSVPMGRRQFYNLRARFFKILYLRILGLLPTGKTA